MKRRVEVRVTGRVQMVMFRDFAQRKARKLGLTGTVQNMNDGSVFVVADGEEENLLEYINYLKKGSVLAHVKSVELKWIDTKNEFKKFSILYEHSI